MPASPPVNHALGLALSGGGSRAAAFHCGTVRGLAKVGLLSGVDVVSTVSGGSLFGAAWLTARARQTSDPEFLAHMATELERGFLLRSVRPGLWRVILPGYTLTDALAETFDRIFFEKAQLQSLPHSPRLCVNATVLNHGQVGKFARDGFSTPDAATPAGDRIIPVTKLRLARAVAASAAFPVGLAPVTLSRITDLAGARFSGRLEGHQSLTLTDGGVLENLGVQTLLRSERFWTWDLVVSDAGTREKPWRPGLLKRLKTAAIALLTGGTLDQILTLMNDKENRSMRQQAYSTLEATWLVEAVRGGVTPSSLAPGLAALLSEHCVLPRRKLLFVRVNQTLESLVTGIAPWRLVELWSRAHDGRAPPAPPPSAYADRRAFLRDLGIDLSTVDAAYGAMGGRFTAEELNAVKTHFTALSQRDIEKLASHAEWQVLATHALYWT